MGAEQLPSGFRNLSHAALPSQIDGVIVTFNNSAIINGRPSETAIVHGGSHPFFPRGQMRTDAAGGRQNLALPLRQSWVQSGAAKTVISLHDLSAWEDWGAPFSIYGAAPGTDRIEISKNDSDNLFLQDAISAWMDTVSIPVRLGELALIVCTIYEGVTTLYQWTRTYGVESQTQTNGTPQSSGTKSALVIGNSSFTTAARSVAGQLYYGAFLNGGISAKQFRALAADPWQLIAPRRRRVELIAHVVAAGGGTTPHGPFGIMFNGPFGGPFR